ncbi:Alpha/beta hydrolase fold-1 [Rhexocercosporidium sp. MPI-PUGE-AT-0058]|nr:Alpha/beta hydrolase fold-1 [Rhexocercosporidium sp. MPI-PUGE-AT-0058]
MSSSKPTIVIAPGAWQLPVGFSGFVSLLRGAGYATELVGYPSVGGTGSPLPGLAEDVAATRAALKKVLDEGKQALLLCHSYGGVVGSCAVEGYSSIKREKEGKKGGVKLVVYMSAFMIPKGKSLLDMLGGQPLPWMDVQGEKTVGVKSMMKEVAFNDMSDEKAAIYMEQMSHSSTSVFATPSTFEPWANDVDCAYIFCTEDNALPLPIQQQMAQQLGPEPVTWSLKAGHCPFMSIPDQLLEVVKKAADRPK